MCIRDRPEAFAHDPERLARFRREAQLLASLNHPNIAAIHGLEEQDGLRYLVLEYVPGPTLAERLKRGPLPVEEALEICRQIAQALEAAHEKGIIHRDLKPANVKVTPQGKVKVLDFGLAKAFEPEGSEADLSKSPTISEAATRAGVLLGTAAYMSPEQARGKPVDKRTDIWAFGCLLYEMLTGRGAFQGPTVSDTLASVLKTEPDWSALPPETAPKIRELARRCLQKDPDRRLHEIADARIEIEEAVEELRAPAPVTVPLRPRFGPWKRILPWICMVLVTLGAAATVWHTWRSAAADRLVTRFKIDLPPNQGTSRAWTLMPNVALSPDGKWLAYVVQEGESTRLYLRAMDQLEARALPRTEGARTPFFSPDGSWIGFHAEGKLKKMAVTGGSPVTICEVLQRALPGATWGADDTIVFSPGWDFGLARVPASGGAPQILMTPDRAKGETGYKWPQRLSGDALLFTINPGNIASMDDGQIAVETPGRRDRTIVLAGGGHGRYVPTGHLVFGHGGSLLAAPFEMQARKLSAPAVPVVEGVLMDYTTGAAQFTFSDSGALAYIPGGMVKANDSLVLVNRVGAAEPLGGPHAYFFEDPSVSPDGQRIALRVAKANDDIHVYDVQRGTLARLTFESGNEWRPVWTPDGTRLAYSAASGAALNIFWKAADGSGPPERIVRGDRLRYPSSFSPDGKILAFVDIDPVTGPDIWTVPLEGNREAQPFLRTAFREILPVFSPDGRWMAYASDESGDMQVYVVRFPEGATKRQISRDGGTAPQWAPNGKELFYRHGERLMVVDVPLEPSQASGKPQVLFESRFKVPTSLAPGYGVMPDGERFVFVKPGAPEPVREIVVVLNWFEDLKRRVPTDRR